MAGLSKRAQPLARDNCFLQKYCAVCLENKWSSDRPEGIVNLGTAENYLCDDLSVAKFQENGFYEFDASMLRYYCYHGSPRTLKPVANFIETKMKADHSIDPENMAMVLGTCSSLDICAHLIGDPGDVFLCPTPYYGRIRNNSYERELVEIYPVHLSSKLEPGEKWPFELTLSRVKGAYEKAISEGKNVKAMVILNPNNPLGTVCSREQLLPILEFLAEKGLFCILDEIYALSTFNLDSESTFDSALRFWKRLPDPQRVVWLWGTSKDFGNAGTRASFVYSTNRGFMDCVKKLVVFQCVPIMVHRMVEKFFLDRTWIENVFLPTNHGRMRENYELAKTHLRLLGIPHLPTRAGFFIFADFRQYLKGQTFEAECILFEKFFNAGVYVVPGRTLFCNEPGWFRIVFTVPTEALKEGFSRISAALADLGNSEVNGIKRSQP